MAPDNINRRAERVHVILTGQYRAAVTDLRPKMVNFDRGTMRGETEKGPFWIVSVERPERLRGALVSSYEVHPSSELLPSSYLAQCEHILAHLLRSHATEETEQLRAEMKAKVGDDVLHRIVKAGVEVAAGHLMKSVIADFFTPTERAFGGGGIVGQRIDGKFTEKIPRPHTSVICFM